MMIFVNIIEAAFVIYAGIWCIRFYTGRLNYVGGKEKERKRRVQKYGWLMIIGIVLCLTSGVGLLIVTWIKYLR